MVLTHIQIDWPDTNHWSAPEPGVVKLNSDIASFSESGGRWIGAVARDHRGQSVCQSIDRCSTVEEAETVAALIGLKELAKVYR